MQELTREQWAEAAGRLGAEANAIEEAVAEVEEMLEAMERENPGEMEHEAAYERRRIEERRGHAHDLRTAIAGMLWISENAAERIRFEIGDA